MKNQKIFLVTENELNAEQQEYVRDYYDEEVSSNVIPLMIENIPQFPNLRDKSIYLAVIMWKKDSALKKKYALIEIPSRVLGRFILLPSKADEHRIILLEDVIRFNLPEIFSYFGYDQYHAHVFKVTRDAELEIDNDVSTNLMEKITKGLKNRRKGKPVRFVYDREMDPGLLEYLTRRLNLSRRDNLIPGVAESTTSVISWIFPNRFSRSKNPENLRSTIPFCSNAVYRMWCWNGILCSIFPIILSRP
jgi:polyphosphate kinase